MDAYVQNGAVHIALVTAAPPPSAVAAAPRPLLDKVLRIADIIISRFQRIHTYMKNVSPRSGRIVCPASADAVKRTAPPPTIPKPLTTSKNNRLDIGFLF